MILPNIITIIGNAYELYRKQTVLNQITLWTFFPAMWLSTALESVFSTFFTGAILFPLTLVTSAVIVVIVTFGQAATLIIAKRVLGHPAGRSRTSLRQVCKSARGFIIPLLLTGILRSCFSILWGLLLIIPGIIYALRTFFFDIIIITEKKNYRAALKESIVIVKGHTWSILIYVIGIQILFFLPVYLLTYLINHVITQHTFLSVFVHGIDSLLIAYAMMFELLTKTVFIKTLRTIPIQTIHPPEIHQVQH